QGDADRDRERPLERVRQHVQGERGQGAEDEEPRSPAGQDARAEQRDAEQDAARQVPDAGDGEGRLHQADVTVDRVTDARGEDVVDVARGAVRQGRQYV